MNSRKLYWTFHDIIGQFIIVVMYSTEQSSSRYCPCHGEARSGPHCVSCLLLTPLLYCAVLFCTVLYCTVLVRICSVLFCSVKNLTVLYCYILYCTVLLLFCFDLKYIDIMHPVRYFILALCGEVMKIVILYLWR